MTSFESWKNVNEKLATVSLSPSSQYFAVCVRSSKSDAALQSFIVESISRFTPKLSLL